MTWYDGLFGIWIDPKNTTKKKIAKRTNGYVFRFELAKLVRDGMNRYRIKNLPDTVSERVVLASLLFYGYVFFFKKNGNILALPGLPDGSGINPYGDFSGAYVYGCNGYNEHISLLMPGAEDSRFLQKTIEGTFYKDGTGIMVREDPTLQSPFINTTVYFANCISDTYRTLDVCRKNMKRPFIVVAEESVVSTVKKYFEDVEDNLDYIISSGVFPADKISVQPFDNNPDYVKISTGLIDWYEQKYRELCGFNNMGGSMDKKGENLITAEVTQNDGYTKQNVDQALKYINEGLELANEKFGTNMKAEATEYEDIQRNDTGEPDNLPVDTGRADEGDDL